MKMATASHNRRAKLGAFVLLALIPAGVIAGAFLFLNETISRLASERATLIATAAHAKGRIQQAKQALGDADKNEMEMLSRDFLPGTQNAIIQAELQNRLRVLLDANGIVLTSHNALPPKTSDGATYIGLRLIARGQLPDIQKFLHSVETLTPVLFVHRAQMRVDLWQPSTQAMPHLLCEFDIFGAKLPATSLAQTGSQSAPPDFPPAGIGAGDALKATPGSRQSRSRL